MASPLMHVLIVGTNKSNRHTSSSILNVVDDEYAAKMFFDYHLKVMRRNIYTLCDETVVRDNIISAFRSHLIDNEVIQYGDPVVVYFAGHGPICSHVPGRGSPRNATSASNGQSGVSDISCCDIDILVSDFVLAKGDNITVILDCDHSCDSNRLLELSSGRDLLSHPSEGSYGHSILQHSSLSSAMVLTAGAAEEDHLRFSRILFQAMRKAVLHTLSYQDLIASVRYEYGRQHPDVGEAHLPGCYGIRQSTLVFNGMILGYQKPGISGHVTEDSITVDAGAIHGVVPGTRFAVCEKKATFWIIGHLVAKSVHDVWSYVNFAEEPFTVPAEAQAKILLSANAPFHFGVRGFPEAQRNAVKICEDELFQDIATGSIPLQQTYPDSAKLVLSFHGMQPVLHRRDPLISTHCASEIKASAVGDGRVQGRDYCRIIDLAATFDLHLYRENHSCPYRSKITVNLWALDSAGKPKGIGHVVDGCADVQHNDSTSYALEIWNGNDTDLWCSVFYFDPSDYSIVQVYKPEPDQPSLKKHESLELGSVGSGVDPCCFYLTPEENHDTGFLKIFVSDVFTDLSMLDQNGSDEAGFPSEFITAVRDGPPSVQGSRNWDTVTTVVHVYRHNTIRQIPRDPQIGCHWDDPISFK